MSVDISPYSDVVVVNAPKVALELSLKLKSVTMDEQRKSFAGSALAGWFYLFRDGCQPNNVYECVVSTSHDDAIASVYKNHPIFTTPGQLMTARECLVRMLADKVGLSVENVGIDDPGRGRSLALPELSTGQLIDLLAERMGSSIIVTDNHAALDLGIPA